MKGPVMALDVGTRRIGVAVSDDDGRMALPLKTLDARSRNESVRQIIDLASQYEVSEIVVGWPLNMQGREGRAVDRVRTLVEALERTKRAQGMEAVSIRRWDERLTTVAADRLLADADVSRRRRKQAVDQVAACKILEGYLARRRRRVEDES